jgi:glycosyltransferase involved in cell wall biosynthesis
MRVLYILGQGGFGGIERHVQGILQNLDPTTVAPHLCVVMKHGPVSEAIAHSGIPVTILRGANGHDGRIVPKLLNLLRTFKPDIIHAHEMQVLVLMTLLLHPQIPVVFSVHCPVKVRDQSWWRSQLILRGMLGRVNHFAGVSQSTLDTLLAYAPQVATRSSVIFNGLSLADLAPRDPLGVRQELGIRADAPIVCGVGRLAEQKDWGAFLDVCASIATAHPACHFLAIGDGPLRDTLHRRSDDLRLAKNLHWLGGRPDARRLLGASDLFLFTSVHEELPTTLLEAFAMRTPVVGFLPKGGTAEVLALSRGREPALLAQTRDCGRLVKACLSLLQNPAQARAMADEGYDLVHRHFDVRLVAAKFVKLYESLATKDNRYEQICCQISARK